MDDAGDLLIADPQYNRIRKVTPDGIINTIAGGGSGGDGGLATAALLSGPTGVAVDGQGNVYIAEPASNRIRMVNPGGIISTIAGTGMAGFSGDGGNSANAELNSPEGVAVDAFGNLYIADSGNNRIRKVVLNAGSVAPTVSAVVNSATNAPGEITPGALVTIYGAELSGGTAQASAFPWPAILNGTEVVVGGQPVPVWFVSAGQVNAQVLFNLPSGGSAQVTVLRGGVASAPFEVLISPAQPGIFTLNEQGTGQGLIVRSDGVTLAQPGTPAAIGETVAIYCTGLGAVAPPVTAGVAAPGSTLSYTSNQVTVQIGGQSAYVSFASLAPGSAGLYQVNAVVPSGAPTGDSVSVVVSVAGQSSPAATIAIQ